MGHESGILQKKVPERAAAALRCPDNANVTNVSACFHRKADFSSESLNTLPGSKRTIGGGSGRELTPRVVGSVPSGRQQGRVHRRLVRAERPVDCQCRIGRQATAGHGSTVVTGHHAV
ncbi:hypothetical protein ERJ75_001550200 [Trypanosoma vivax]|nr:hypothetical protein ERJ75_001550200 [Trypanosoma vivax]